MDAEPDVAIYQRVRRLQNKAWKADRGQRYKLYASIAVTAFTAGVLVGWGLLLLTAG